MLEQNITKTISYDVIRRPLFFKSSDINNKEGLDRCVRVLPYRDFLKSSRASAIVCVGQKLQSRVIEALEGKNNTLKDRQSTREEISGDWQSLENERKTGSRGQKIR